VVYEVRDWFDGNHCLFTDDRRVKELAESSKQLAVVTSYFRRPDDSRPFAWDIAGPSGAIGRLVRQTD
jgi:hypothetical protein